MYRFVAFAWRDSSDERADEVRRQMAQIAAEGGRTWSLAYRARGVEVWHAEDRAGRMDAVSMPGGGVLLGRVLSRAEGFPDWSPTSLDGDASTRDPADRTRSIFANFWGSYVGVFPQQHPHPFAIVRDPGGGLPCYRYRWRDFDVLFSNAEDLRYLPDVRLSLDLEVLATNALLPLACKATTGLNEIEEVLPGECLLLSEPVDRRFLWAPMTIARKTLGIDTAEIAERMRVTLRSVTEAMVRPYGRVLHSLGGLDSSILLTCLAGAGTSRDVRCVNYFTDSLSGDERNYARLMAAHANVPLIERRLKPERVDLDVWRKQEMGPSPPVGFDSLTLAGDVLGLTEEFRPDVLSYGTGGDCVFFQAPYVFSALDYVAARAPAGRLGRVALEAAQYGGKSLAFTVSAMIAERLRPAPCFEAIIRLLEPGIVSDFLHPDLAVEWASPEKLHPMLRPDQSFPKGKYLQVLASAFFNLEGHRYRFPPQQETDFVCPLLAQPFVELCLQIPTWELADGGVSRGLARRAFWKDLPRTVAGRTSKSATGSVYESLFARNRLALRETLLDGVLANANFFNRKQLDTALNGSRDQLVASDVSLLFDFYAWEIWARRWAS